MKRMLAALLVMLFLFSSVSLADTPAVREDYPRTKVSFLYSDYS